VARKRPSASVTHLRTLRSLVAGTVAIAAATLTFAPAAGAVAVSPPLGVAETFAVLGGSAVTNTGATVITGDVGVSPGSSIAGFPPGQVSGTVYNSGPVATAAQADIGTAFGFTAGQACDQDLSGLDLGGMTITPGVYCYASSAQLTGVLKLDALGDPTATWLFKTTSSLTTASNAAVVLVNGGSQCTNNITWHIGSSATVGSGSIFLGNIIANTSITLATGAGNTGSLYAHTGAVTLDTNAVSTCDGTAIPPPPPLTISTTPSGSVPPGGPISDSATVGGGLSPSGDVTFKLYGPTDPTCAGTPLATRTGTLDNNRVATSGAPVTAGAEGTYNWVATYGGDANNGSVVSPCGDEEVLVKAPTLTGRAFGLSATLTLAGISLVNQAPTPDTGHVSTKASTSTTTPCRAALPGLVTAHLLCANVTTSTSPSQSVATASVADAGVAGLALTAGAVKSTSTTTCAGSVGTTVIDFLKVGPTVVIAVPTTIPANTGVTVGAVSLMLNEQIPFTVPDAGLTVNAIHVRVNALGLAQTNVIVASSESDIGDCP
jgi:Ice-binding-like